MGLVEVVEEHGRFGELIGKSIAMRRLYDLLDRVAASDATTLVTGESGTGKELVARELHRRSARAEEPFVAINCGAIPAALLESELFGHAAGAFTDARRARVGLFLEASGGTLFLDEIGELPLPLQAKLLRVLQERTIRPLGMDREIAVDLRVIAATNDDPDAAAQAGRLRKDLYFRLNVIRVEVPPLRARGMDVLLLAQIFVRRVAARAGKSVGGLSVTAASGLLAYDWPGNVRELQNCIEHAVALAETDRIELRDLPDAIRECASRQTAPAPADAPLATLEEVERQHILHVLERVGGQRKAAALILGLDRKTLYRKLAGYGIRTAPSD
jgi:two-component system response regulator HydG